jgi:hypothetical protein
MVGLSLSLSLSLARARGQRRSVGQQSKVAFQPAAGHRRLAEVLQINRSGARGGSRSQGAGQLCRRGFVDTGQWICSTSAGYTAKTARGGLHRVRGARGLDLVVHRPLRLRSSCVDRIQRLVVLPRTEIYERWLEVVGMDMQWQWWIFWPDR